MDKLKLAMNLVKAYGGTVLYVGSLFAVLEFGYLLGMSLVDGHIDHDEYIAMKAASERVAQSLPNPTP
jgi:hypothetical protein